MVFHSFAHESEVRVHTETPGRYDLGRFASFLKEGARFTVAGLRNFFQNTNLSRASDKDRLEDGKAVVLILAVAGGAGVCVRPVQQRKRKAKRA